MALLLRAISGRELDLSARCDARGGPGPCERHHRSVRLGAHAVPHRDVRLAVRPLEAPLLPDSRSGQDPATRLAGVLRRSASRPSSRTPPSTTCRRDRPSRPGATARPTDFIVAVKVSRYLTHIRKLNEPQEPVERFVERSRGLGDKLGPGAPATAAAVGARPRPAARNARRHSQAGCASRWSSVIARGGPTRCGHCSRSTARPSASPIGVRPVSPIWRTTDWTYVRFHGGRGHRRAATATMPLRRGSIGSPRRGRSRRTSSSTSTTTSMRAHWPMP